MLSYAPPIYRAGLAATSPLWIALRTRSLFGDRPPLRDTLTGQDTASRKKSPDPNWGLDDNKRKQWVAKLQRCLKNRWGDVLPGCATCLFASEWIGTDVTPAASGLASSAVSKVLGA